MQALRPSAKVGIVVAGFMLALALAWFAVDLRQRATQGPVAQASSGMYAEGDSLLGLLVLAAASLGPAALALHWLRPVPRFWSALVWSAMIFALSGLVALAATMSAGDSRNPWLFLAEARIGLMPLSALAFLTGAIFTPRTRDRWLLLAATACDGAVFAGVVLVHFIIPELARR